MTKVYAIKSGLPRRAGVYEISTPSGKRYIGSSHDIQRRWNAHRCFLRKGMHSNGIMQHSANKYGVDEIACRVLLFCSVEHLVLFEQRVMDSYKPEINMLMDAASRRGFKHSEETKAKISKANKGQVVSEAQRRLISERKKGVKRAPFSEACKRKMSLSRTGQKRTPEQLVRMAAAQKLRRNAERQQLALRNSM